MSGLVEFGTEIWIADGPPVRFIGLPFPTRTIVVRLRDGGLWIDSPVALTAEQADSLERLGPVRHLVAPTPLHVWRLEGWRTRYPGAKCWTPDELADTPPPEWSTELDQLIFRGNRVFSEVEFFHRPSRTLVVADILQQHGVRPGRPLVNALTAIAGVRGLGVPVDIRLSFAGNRTGGRRSLQRLLSWDFDNLILAHGDCVAGGAKPLVRRAFRWLSGEK